MSICLPERHMTNAFGKPAAGHFKNSFALVENYYSQLIKPSGFAVKADWCETISLECSPEVKVTSKTAMGNASLLEEPPSGMSPFDLLAATWVLGEYLKRSLTNQGDAFERDLCIPVPTL